MPPEARYTITLELTTGEIDALSHLLVLGGAAAGQQADQRPEFALQMTRVALAVASRLPPRQALVRAAARQPKSDDLWSDFSRLLRDRPPVIVAELDEHGAVLAFTTTLSALRTIVGGLRESQQQWVARLRKTLRAHGWAFTPAIPTTDRRPRVYRFTAM